MLKKGNSARAYATREDFCRLFAENLNSLYQLAFLLTADHERAEQAFFGGIEDSITSNNVFKDWARSWAKRVVIQNAIGILQPRPANEESSMAAVIAGRVATDVDSGHFHLGDILSLEAFERFVFVMSVLERYSDADCAVLLRSSILDIRAGRLQALRQLVSSPVAPSGSTPEVQECDEPCRFTTTGLFRELGGTYDNSTQTERERTAHSGQLRACDDRLATTDAFWNQQL